MVCMRILFRLIGLFFWLLVQANCSRSNFVSGPLSFWYLRYQTGGCSNRILTMKIKFHWLEVAEPVIVLTDRAKINRFFVGDMGEK